MRLRKWKSILSICTAGVLVFSAPAYASQITITPLETGVSSTQSGQSPSGNAAPQAPAAAPQTTAAPQATTAAAQTSSAPQTPAAAAQTTAAADQIAKPSVASEGAVLLDAATGNVLFSKNGDTRYYPASITKLMTALLVAESCNLDDTVTFSATATTNLESGAVSIGMAEGDTMTVRQCLYALLLKSANEVGNALAEHVAGSNAAFADRMNAKAAALGCTNTHFTNPHGLNDANHYTSAHDMALIARAAFQNDTVKTVASTRTYTLPATKNNPSGLTVTIGHKMLNPSDSRYYPGIIGGKTGYTSKAGNTLVTAAERDGVRLIAVVMKSKSTHYTDTKAMLDYGYELAAAGAITGGTGTAGAVTGTASPVTGTAGAVTGTASPAATDSGAGNSGGPGALTDRGWVKDNTGWYYVKDNGVKAAGEWITDGGENYWLDTNTYMVKGWHQVDGKWYYLRSNGAMAKNYWATVAENGQWFYLGPDGVMLTNTTTPDGCRVDESGAWVK